MTDRTSDDYMKAAEQALAQAETLAASAEPSDKAKQLANDSQIIAKSRKMNDKEFLESMATGDSLIDHDPEECGMCGHQFIMAQTARDMLAAGDIEDGINKWSLEARRRWEEGKYFKLWQEAVAAGRDPHEVFAEKGWEP